MKQLEPYIKPERLARIHLSNYEIISDWVSRLKTATRVENVCSTVTCICIFVLVFNLARWQFTGMGNTPLLVAVNVVGLVVNIVALLLNFYRTWKACGDRLEAEEQLEHYDPYYFFHKDPKKRR